MQGTFIVYFISVQNCVSQVYVIHILTCRETGGLWEVGCLFLYTLLDDLSTK